MATSFPPSICLGNPKMVSLSDFKVSSLGYVLLLNWLDFRLGLGGVLMACSLLHLVFESICKQKKKCSKPKYGFWGCVLKISDGVLQLHKLRNLSLRLFPATVGFTS
jgi:hypothetical protein